MGLQLVPLAEALPTVLMVTLEASHNTATANYMSIKTKQRRKPWTKYPILPLLLVMNAGHVVLQAAVGDEGLRTPVDQAPEDQKDPQH